MKVTLKLAVLATLVFLAPAISTSAAPVLTLQGTGADADLLLTIISSVPLNTPGLTNADPGMITVTSFFPGDTLGLLQYSAGSGVLRFIDQPADGDDFVRTFDFASFINNGVYNATGGGGSDSATLTVTGSTDAIPEPTSAALIFAGLGAVGFLRLRRGSS